MEYGLLLNIISATSAFLATAIAYRSFNLNRDLIKQNSDRIDLSVMPKCHYHNNSSISDDQETLFCLTVRFISPRNRKTEITHVAYYKYQTKLNYYLANIPILRKLSKRTVYLPTKFLEGGGIASLFVDGVVQLEDGKCTTFLKPTKDLIKMLGIARKNFLVIEVVATPDYVERAQINAKDIFD